jgi:hypothetical protein
MEASGEALRKFEEELNLLRKDIANGQADNYANYKQLVGRIQGVEWAEEVLKSIIKRMYEGEEQ